MVYLPRHLIADGHKGGESRSHLPETIVKERGRRSGNDTSQATSSEDRGTRQPYPPVWHTVTGLLSMIVSGARGTGCLSVCLIHLSRIDRQPTHVPHFPHFPHSPIAPSVCPPEIRSRLSRDSNLAIPRDDRRDCSARQESQCPGSRRSLSQRPDIHSIPFPGCFSAKSASQKLRDGLGESSQPTERGERNRGLRSYQAHEESAF